MDRLRSSRNGPVQDNLLHFFTKRPQAAVRRLNDRRACSSLPGCATGILTGHGSSTEAAFGVRSKRKSCLFLDHYAAAGIGSTVTVQSYESAGAQP
jgi:hypothetical protein